MIEHTAECYAPRRRTEAEARRCSQDSCPGDGRYQPPGKGHLPGCQHNAVAWVWGTVRTLSDPVVELGRLSLAFSRVDRITYHEDALTRESDADHTVMLGLIGCAFAASHLPHLDVGLVAQFALVHDLVEAYAGDTPTLHALSADAKAAKQEREHRAYLRIVNEFGTSLPWLPQTIEVYEQLDAPEACYVKALDKLLPKITHILNGGVTLAAQGMDAARLAARYDLQLAELEAYAGDFPILFDLRAELVARVLDVLTPKETPVP